MADSRLMIGSLKEWKPTRTLAMPAVDHSFDAMIFQMISVIHAKKDFVTNAEYLTMLALATLVHFFSISRRPLAPLPLTLDPSLCTMFLLDKDVGLTGR
jgi:hypothetical protein